MKRGSILFLVLILLVSFVSAGWFSDLFDGKSITGNAIYSTGGDVTVYANNTAEIRNPTLDGHLLHIKPESAGKMCELFGWINYTGYADHDETNQANNTWTITYGLSGSNNSSLVYCPNNGIWSPYDCRYVTKLLRCTPQGQTPVTNVNLCNGYVYNSPHATDRVSYSSFNSWSHNDSVCIQLLSPNAGANLSLGETYQIRWKSVGVDFVSIMLKSCPSCIAGNIVTNFQTSSAAGEYSYNWTIIKEYSNQYNNALGPTNLTIELIGGNSSLGDPSFDGSDKVFKVINNSNVVSYSCNDSDGGLNYNIRGTTHGILNPYTTQYGDLVDYCDTSNNINSLIEYSCDYSSGVLIAYPSLYSCPNGCSNGACIQNNQYLIDLCSGLSEEVKQKVAFLESQGLNVSKTEGNYVYRGSTHVNYLVVGNNTAEGLYGGVLKVTTITNNTAGYANDKVRLQDAINGNTYEATLTAEGVGTITIGPEVYDLRYYGSSLITEDDRYITLNRAPMNIIETFNCDYQLPVCIPEYSCNTNPLICPQHGTQVKTCIDTKCNSPENITTISCDPGVCSGCMLNDKCIPYGFRIDNSGVNSYCDIDGEVKAQRTKDPNNNDWAKCQNNYECESNVCSSGECIELKALAQEAAGFKGSVIKMLCRLSNVFSTDGYNQCLAEYLGY